ncbi:MAG: site-specific integrase [Actinomycetota bacterium]
MARGSVFQRNGSYGFRIDLEPDPSTGRRRQMSRQGFRTKREADNELRKALSDVAEGVAVNRTSVDVRTYLDEWLEGQRQHLKETTWSSYEVAVKRITHGLGASKLKALAPLEIESFYADLAETGSRAGKPLSAKSVRNTHVVLRKALADAERLGLVPRNAAAAAKPPTVQPKEQQTWDSDQLVQFFETVGDDLFFAAYVLAATTGMRRGEVLGLRWSDVDLDGGQLAVRQTVTTVNYKPVITTPKTKRSRRVVYLDEHTINVLRAQRRHQTDERRAAGKAWSDEHDLIFRDELGDMINPDWFSREFTRQVKLSGLPKIRFHDLRHSYATLALKAGVHPKVVSERLGHATVGITLDLYSHVTPAIARDAADAVAGRLFGGLE